MRFVLLIFLIVVLVSCDSTELRTFESTEVEVIDGLTRDIATGDPVTGIVLERYQNGHLRTETVFENGEKAVIRLFSGKGSLSEIMYYKDDVLQRVEYGWAEDGQVLVEKVYLSDGEHYVRHGYHENGKTHTLKQRNTKGILDGPSRTWDEKGRLVSEECFNNGRSVDMSHCP